MWKSYPTYLGLFLLEEKEIRQKDSLKIRQQQLKIYLFTAPQVAFIMHFLFNNGFGTNELVDISQYVNKIAKKKL